MNTNIVKNKLENDIGETINELVSQNNLTILNLKLIIVCLKCGASWGISIRNGTPNRNSFVCRNCGGEVSHG